MRFPQQSATAKENKDLWSTPLEIVSYFNSRANKPIALDAAASNFNAVLSNHINEEENTLTTPWASRVNVKKGSVWMNPPFSDITPFVDAAIKSAIDGCEVTLLVTNSTCAAWFHKASSMATSIYLPRGRIAFISAATGKPVGRNDRGTAVFHFDPKRLGLEQLFRPLVSDMMQTPVDPRFLKHSRFGN